MNREKELTEAERHRTTEVVTELLLEILTDRLRNFFKRGDTLRDLKAAGRKGRVIDRAEKARNKAGRELLGVVKGIVHPGERKTEMKPRGSPTEKFQTLVDALHGLGFVTEITPGVPNVIRIPLGLEEGERRGHVEFLIENVLLKEEDPPRMVSAAQMVVFVSSDIPSTEVHLVLRGGNV